MSKRIDTTGGDFIKPPSSGSNTNTTTLSHLISPNIESFYFALPSPQETDLSDPEGCSLRVPARWRSSRCSCSASPTHSMSMELYLDQKDPPINIKIIEQQRIQEQLILQQQILLKQQQDQLQRLLEQANLVGRPIAFRRPKVLASIESDGLSSTSSSSDDLFVPLRRSRPPSSPLTNYHHHQQQQIQQQSSQHHANQQQSQHQPRQQLDLPHHHNYHPDHSYHHHQPLSSASETASNKPFRSELSSEFSSTNQSDLDSPLHLDLDENLSRTLGRLSPSDIGPPSAPSDGLGSTAKSSDSCAQDKRFPLLKEGALGSNGLLPRKR